MLPVVVAVVRGSTSSGSNMLVDGMFTSLNNNLAGEYVLKQHLEDSQVYSKKYHQGCGVYSGTIMFITSFWLCISCSF